MNNAYDNEYIDDDVSLAHLVAKKIEEAVDKSIPLVSSGLIDRDVVEIKSEIFDYVYEDLIALTKKDRAAKGSPDYVFNTFLTFRAVMYYRIANTIYARTDIFEGLREHIAKKISEYAKGKTKIHIEPTATIGRRFVIDHGTDTVIGEKCTIGSDCYILNRVILGAREFGSPDIPEDRHPKIGDNVRIAAFVRILGPITVGDNVFIGPHCIITHDIPSNCNVIIVNQLQICRGSTSDCREIYGIVPEDSGIIYIYGKGLMDSSVSLAELLDEDIRENNDFDIIIKERDDNIIKLQVSIKNEIMNNEIKEKLKEVLIIKNDEKEIIVTKAIGLKRAIESLIENKIGA
jgi:serine O-acetyltransferase